MTDDPKPVTLDMGDLEPAMVFLGTGFRFGLNVPKNSQAFIVWWKQMRADGAIYLDELVIPTRSVAFVIKGEAMRQMLAMQPIINPPGINPPGQAMH